MPSNHFPSSAFGFNRDPRRLGTGVPCRQQRSAQVLLLAPAGGEPHRAGAPGGSSAVPGSPAQTGGPVQSRARLLLASQTPRALLLEQSGRPEPSAAVPRARRENFGKSAPLHPHAASPSRPEGAVHPLSPPRRGAQAGLHQRRPFPSRGAPGAASPPSPAGTGLPRGPPPPAPGSGQLPRPLPSPGPFSASPGPHKGSGRPGGGGRVEWPPPPPLREKKGLRQPQRWRSEGEKSPPHPRTRCAQHRQGAPHKPRWGVEQAGSAHPTPAPPRPSPRGWPCPGAQSSEARASSSSHRRRHPLLPTTIIIIITPPPGGTACRLPRRAARLIAAPSPPPPPARPAPAPTPTPAPRPSSTPPSERPVWGGPRGAPEKPQKGVVRCHTHTHTHTPRVRGALPSLRRVWERPCSHVCAPGGSSLRLGS